MSGIRLGGFVIALVLSLSAIVQAQNSAPSVVFQGQTPNEAKLAAALSRKVSLDVQDEPLNAVLKSLEQQADVRFHLTRKIEDAGVQPDQPVTFKLHDVSLRSCLRHFLRSYNLTYLIKDDVIKITTVEDAQSAENLRTRVYAVKDLIPLGPKTPIEEREAYDALTNLIRSTIYQDSWSETGGSSSIRGYPNTASLVVITETPIHDQIENLLAALRQLKALQTPDAKPGSIPVVLPVASQSDLGQRRKIEAALDKMVAYDFTDEKLNEVCARIAKDAGIRILLTKRIEDAGIQPDQPVTLKLGEVSLRAFLRVLLNEFNLTFLVQDEVLCVTTVEDAQSPENLAVRIFPVRDLVDQPKDHFRPLEIGYGPLAHLVMSVEADSWDGQQGLSDEPLTASLVIPQREDIHERIADLLTQLRKAKAAQGLDRAADTAPKVTIPPPATRPAAPR